MLCCDSSREADAGSLAHASPQPVPHGKACPKLLTALLVFVVDAQGNQCKAWVFFTWLWPLRAWACQQQLLLSDVRISQLFHGISRLAPPEVDLPESLWSQGKRMRN